MTADTPTGGMPERIWYDGTSRHARNLRWEPPTSDIHPQHEYVPATVLAAATERAMEAEEGRNAVAGNVLHLIGSIRDLRAERDALRAAVDAAITDLENDPALGALLCCTALPDGCGCQGATLGEYVATRLRSMTAALTPKEPPHA